MVIFFQTNYLTKLRNKPIDYTIRPDWAQRAPYYALPMTIVEYLEKHHLIGTCTYPRCVLLKILNEQDLDSACCHTHIEHTLKSA